MDAQGMGKTFPVVQKCVRKLPTLVCTFFTLFYSLHIFNQCIFCNLHFLQDENAQETAFAHTYFPLYYSLPIFIYNIFVGFLQFKHSLWLRKVWENSLIQPATTSSYLRPKESWEYQITIATVQKIFEYFECGYFSSNRKAPGIFSRFIMIQKVWENVQSYLSCVHFQMFH